MKKNTIFHSDPKEGESEVSRAVSTSTQSRLMSEEDARIFFMQTNTTIFYNTTFR